MKKVAFTLLLLVLLTGLLGCKTTRATLKTDTEQQTLTTEVTDSSRHSQQQTSDQVTAALTSSEQKNVVVAFEEWEYYPAATNNTLTGENYAHNSAFFIRTSGESADKPPNAGSLKRHKKGTITINADRQTEATSEQTKHTEAEETAKGSTSKKSKADIKQKAKSTESKEATGAKWYVWIVIGLICAALFLWVGTDIARRADR